MTGIFPGGNKKIYIELSAKRRQEVCFNAKAGGVDSSSWSMLDMS